MLTALSLTMAFALMPVQAAVINKETSKAFNGSDFDWLLSPGLRNFGVTSKNKVALDAVAKLFHDKNPGASIALQNYLDRYPYDPAAFDLAGVILLQKNDYPSATISFRKALKINPSNNWLRAKLGSALVLSGQTTQGKKELQQVIKNDPDNPMALRYLAFMAVQESNLPEAIMHSERALRAFGLPKDTVNQAHFDLAELYLKMFRFNDIVDLLGPAVRNDAVDIPGNTKLELYGRYMDAAMATNNITEARTVMKRIQSLVNTNDPMFKLSQARLTQLEGKPDLGLEMIQKIIETNPSLEKPLRGDIAKMLTYAGKTDEAIVVLREIASEQKQGEDIPYISEIAKVLIQANRAPEAIDQISEFVHGAPDRVDLRLLEVEMLGKVGNPERALILAEQLAGTYPDNANVHYLIGALSAAQGDREIGISAMRRSLEINPKQPSVWLTLAGILHGHGTYVQSHTDTAVGHNEIEDVLHQAIGANPNNPELYTELGLILLSDGRVNEAIVEFDKSVKSSPGHIASLSLGALARADISIDLKTAHAMMERAMAAAPHEPINQDIMGWVKARQGYLEEGIALMLKAAKQAPDDATIQYHLGITELLRGNKKQAQEHLMTAMSRPIYKHNVIDARAKIIETFPAQEVTSQVYKIDGNGVREKIGTLTLKQTAGGLEISTEISGLPKGMNGVHIHERPTCEPSEKGIAGGSAGAHYGRGYDKHTGHSHSHDDNNMPPTGDLQPILFDSNGIAIATIKSTQLTLDEVRARSLMIHLGPDKDGKSGLKIACAIIP
jgi:Cu-Zn family superoxide dismutase